MQKPTINPQQSDIDAVKRDLPQVRVKYNGETWFARVSGRLNEFASVSPYSRTIGNRVETILGPIFHFSWNAVARAHLNGNTLNCDS